MTTMDLQDQDLFKLLEHGEIHITSYDKESRQAALRIYVPCCLIQFTLPILNKFGVIDDYCVKTPILAWMPTLTSDRFKPELIAQYPSVPNEANTQIQKKMQESLNLFVEASKVIISITDIIPMLPLGVYVQLQYRCRIDDIAQVLTGLENAEMIGVPDFRFALAGALTRLLDLVN